MLAEITDQKGVVWELLVTEGDMRATATASAATATDDDEPPSKAAALASSTASKVTLRKKKIKHNWKWQSAVQQLAVIRNSKK